MFNKMKLLQNIKKQYKKNNETTILIDKERYSYLTKMDLEYLIEKGYLKGKIKEVLSGDWYAVCQFTYKTLSYKRYLILEIIKNLGSLFISLFNFIKNIFIFFIG